MKGNLFLSFCLQISLPKVDKSLSFLFHTLYQRTRICQHDNDKICFRAGETGCPKPAHSVSFNYCKCYLFHEQAVIGLEAAHAEGQSSSDWLGRHSVEAAGLSFEEIMKCGIPIK